jgi:hypothetical protein
MMRLRRRAGFTLVELVIYMFLAGLILTMVYSLFFLGRSSFNTAAQGFFIGEQCQTTLTRLRTELSASNIGTVVAYPNAAHPSEPPGIAFESCYDPNNTGKIEVSQFGAALWTQYVYYTLQPAARPNGMTGRLVRWSQSVGGVANIAPSASTVLPSSLGARNATVLNNVLLPNVTIAGVTSGVSGNRGTVTTSTGEGGGFTVSFVQRDNTSATATDVLSAINPTAHMDATGSGLTTRTNTQLVEIDFKVFATNGETGKMSYYEVSARVMPTN